MIGLRGFFFIKYQKFPLPFAFTVSGLCFTIIYPYDWTWHNWQVYYRIFSKLLAIYEFGLLLPIIVYVGLTVISLNMVDCRGFSLGLNVKLFPLLFGHQVVLPTNHPG